MSTTIKNLAGRRFEQKLLQAKSGAEKYLPQNSALELAGKQMTVAQVVLDFAAVLAKFQDVRDAMAIAAQKRQLLHDALPGVRAEYLSFKSYVESKLGRGNPQIAEYGFALGVHRPKSAGTKVLASIKAQQTRKVRHTLGRKQKLALSPVTGPSVTLGPDGKAVSVEETAQPTPPEAVATAVAAGGGSSGGQGVSPKP